MVWYRVAGRRKYSDVPQGINFLPDNISTPQVLGEIGENIPPSKLTFGTYTIAWSTYSPHKSACHTYRIAGNFHGLAILGFSLLKFSQ